MASSSSGGGMNSGAPNPFEVSRPRRMMPATSASTDLAMLERHRGLSRSELLSIQVADWVGAGLTDQYCRGIAHMLHGNRQLEELLIARNRFGDEGARAIAQALAASDSLRVLWLSGNLVADAGTCAIAEVLPRMGWLGNGSHLGELWFASNRIGDAGAVAIAKALPQLPRLTKLDVRCNYIGDEGGCALAAALPHVQPGFEELYMQENRLGDGTAATREVLPGSRWLKELRLGGNRIGNAGAKALALSAPNAPHLRGLRLAHNCVGDAGGSALALALPACRLQRLELACNYGLGDATLLMLAQSVPAARELLSLDLEGHRGAKASERALALALLRAVVFGTHDEVDDAPRLLMLRQLYGVRLVPHVVAIGVSSAVLREELDNGVLLDELRRRRGAVVYLEPDPAAAHRAQDTHRLDPHCPPAAGLAAERQKLITALSPAGDSGGGLSGGLSVGGGGGSGATLPPLVLDMDEDGDAPTGDGATVRLTPAQSVRSVSTVQPLQSAGTDPVPASRATAPPSSSSTVLVTPTPTLPSAAPSGAAATPTVVLTASSRATPFDAAATLNSHRDAVVAGHGGIDRPR